ncbi:hypothetical protein [Halocynthiibacter styelae]|uniref:Uncharacterized protein n=1 Tax=Halocynthiibacter styelae TaxID=2761955 RepID=A0A8J7IEA5_9RHOB|nr:hypothetical protein [Paenihalocynthiibacter styelae]MBI1495373.1 hypothetical protein [Paenihalocynthiibacter styelae]
MKVALHSQQTKEYDEEADAAYGSVQPGPPRMIRKPYATPAVVVMAGSAGVA